MSKDVVIETALISLAASWALIAIASAVRRWIRLSKEHKPSCRCETCRFWGA